MDTTDAFGAALQPVKSARRVVEECLARIAVDNPKLNAVSSLFSGAAISRADALDRAASGGQRSGRLHGLPVLLKDLVDVSGHPTEFGSAAYAAGPAARNAPIVDRLEAEGAIILGKTSMVEFAIGSWGTNAVQGTPWNPADATRHRVPGGSSSGSAVAVAAGLAPVAIGSDTGGSIRIPASLCGVVGFKPTYGLIPTDGVAPLGPTFDTLGPITTNVDDARLLTEVMAGIDLFHSPVLVNGLRIAAVGNDALAPMADDVAGAYAVAMNRLRADGARIETFSLPLSFVEFQKLNGDIVAFEAYRHLGKLVDDPSTQLDPHVRKRVQMGRDIQPARYRELLDELSDVRRSFDRAFAGFDMLILPGTPVSALPLSDVDENQIPMSRFTRVANCLDLCAISIPLSVKHGRMPIGLQLCGPAHSDARLLAIASTIMAGR
jgi:aspartyl-tRNA(Asn)/glutamyl-tRNA(Gln) amidotransferase subunit A